MEFNNNEIRKAIKHIFTRWLSIGQCIERTLKQWESLESYFLSYFDLQVDPTEKALDDQHNRELINQINLKDNKDLFLGIMTKQYAQGFDLIGTTKHNKFLKEVRLFYMKCASYLKSTMPILKDNAIKSLTFLRLREKHKASSYNLQVTMERFPKVILDVNALESKLLEYQTASDSELLSCFDENGKPVRIDLIWHQISQYLSQLAKFLLLLL